MIAINYQKLQISLLSEYDKQNCQNDPYWKKNIRFFVLQKSRKYFLCTFLFFKQILTVDSSSKFENKFWFFQWEIISTARSSDGRKRSKKRT